MVPACAAPESVARAQVAIRLVRRNEKRFIELGPEFGNNWVVERGLVAGEQIVTEGFHKLTPGMKVRAQAAVPKKEEEQTSDSLNKQVVSETKQTTPAENKSKDNNPSK